MIRMLDRQHDIFTIRSHAMCNQAHSNWILCCAARWRLSLNPIGMMMTFEPRRGNLAFFSNNIKYNKIIKSANFTLSVRKCERSHDCFFSIRSHFIVVIAAVRTLLFVMNKYSKNIFIFQLHWLAIGIIALVA